MLKSAVDKIWKALRTLFLLSSLVSAGFMIMNRQMLMSLMGMSSPSSNSTAAAAPANGAGPPAAAPAVPAGLDPSKLAGLISAAAPDNAKAQMAAGALLMRQGKNDEAMAAFQKALKAEPNNVGAHFQVGMILLKHDKPLDAEKEFREAIRIDPKHLDSRFGLAAALQKTATLDQAAAEYQEIIKIDPMNAEAHNNLGIVYDAQGSKDKAMEEFHRAVEMDPENKAAQENLDSLAAELQKSETPTPVAVPAEPLSGAPGVPPPDSSGARPDEPGKPLDILHLANGRMVKGHVLEKTDDGVWLEVGNGKVFFSNGEIAKING